MMQETFYLPSERVQHAYVRGQGVAKEGLPRPLLLLVQREADRGQRGPVRQVPGPRETAPPSGPQPDLIFWPS